MPLECTILNNCFKIVCNGLLANLKYPAILPYLIVVNEILPFFFFTGRLVRAVKLEGG